MDETSPTGFPPNATAAKIRGRPYPLLTLEVFDTTPGAIEDLLLRKIAFAPGFFRGAGVILDLSAAPGDTDPIDIASRVRNVGLVPIGIHGTDEVAREAAQKSGLPTIRPGGPDDAAAVQGTEPVRRPTKIISEPIRSGQVIHAGATDVVVLAPVSAGAVIIAEGNIIVLAPLRGRVEAGAAGDGNARVIADKFEAEFVSIGGLFLSGADCPEDWRGKRGQVLLRDGYLRFAPISC